MLNLIKKGGQLIITDEIQNLMSPTIMQLNILKLIKEQDGNLYVDFQTNVHRLYAMKKIGNSTSFIAKVHDYYNFTLYY